MPKSNRPPNKNPKKIYLDYASATPLDPKVATYVARISLENFANPGAIHDIGVKASKLLFDARKIVASVLKCQTEEVIFTGGATEANNLAIQGIVRSAGPRPHIVTTNIEHASVLEVCRNLPKNKIAEVTYVPVEANGIVDPQKIKKALRPNTVLVSVMYANNEIGTIQPIREIAKMIRHYKKNNLKSTILLHTDAVQAVNYLDINVQRLGVDLMTINGGKIYGPKGVGALYVKRKAPITKINFGGNQEFGLRPGTENLSAIAGLAEALEITEKIRGKESKRQLGLQKYFLSKLRRSNILKNIGMILNGDEELRLPNNINITIPKIPSDLLVIELSARGIYASEKSACKSGDKAGSYVIQALRPKGGEGSLRFSLGRSTTKGDIKNAVKSLEHILIKLQNWYN